ncbi:protein WHAT'S THIS FACTOR 1 homolog, chloroplastic-like isoform X2 [Mangifera indica]|nr:protein WHAT'S THIS FACTOR 1 homolog, chloroplastic-like isoform X2 [Mangifera indica]XP_044507655.1 protein WHAT'S THIS FACTOR 1 homolog, chloroplastic-like isoform X2 [Mangifera indica]XP_044507663.1 protein WHAT'S THIS FACTOR 1 homolog, chloroplastic-like isoform X2 [Mangifera indica]XP_044507672.1 protein WHAT'S THIS FACTOR 1 homolog, chloroplastic-like isoform X2 [Mangifera indica]XP_044507681.1 protein WHAT'S THIS FACTOR 1 homolog, chloroplastic-like isoform X2 [Mangifera indica]XP_04
MESLLLVTVRLFFLVNILYSSHIMYRRSGLSFFHQTLDSYILSSPILIQKSGSMWVPKKQKSSGGWRPKKKIYHRDHELDRAIDLQKKPSLILQLKSIIQSQKHQSLFLRDLEKQVGFVQKWNFMSIIEKYPTMFHVGGGSDRSPPFVTLTEKAKKISNEEPEARALMEPILVKNLRKLLMMSVDCRIPLEKIECIDSELGLPQDFKKTLIPKYPEFFSVKEFNGKTYLYLENWDSSLAFTAREERLARKGILNSSGAQKKVRITKDGNYLGPFAFKMCFPVGFRPNMRYLEELQRWQRMEFPSPYLNARRYELADPKARKRVVAVLHELLSLTMEKRMTSSQLDAFHSEYLLPHRLLLCLIKYHGIFYITNKGARSTVFLKEAYDGSSLIDKCPLLSHNDRFMALTGRREINSCAVMPSL